MVLLLLHGLIKACWSILILPNYVAMPNYIALFLLFFNRISIGIKAWRHPVDHLIVLHLILFLLPGRFTPFLHRLVGPGSRYGNIFYILPLFPRTISNMVAKFVPLNEDMGEVVGAVHEQMAGLPRSLTPV